MTSKEIIYIVIGVAVVALVIVRQLRTRPVRETSAARFTLILGVIGIIALYNAWKGHTVGAPTVAWIVALAARRRRPRCGPRPHHAGLAD